MQSSKKEAVHPATRRHSDKSNDKAEAHTTEARQTKQPSSEEKTGMHQDQRPKNSTSTWNGVPPQAQAGYSVATVEETRPLVTPGGAEQRS